MPKKRTIKLSTKLILTTLGIILAGTLSWAFYNLINKGVTDLLALFRISNIYIQNIIVIIVGAILLFLIGWSGKRIWNKIIR